MEEFGRDPPALWILLPVTRKRRSQTSENIPLTKRLTTRSPQGNIMREGRQLVRDTKRFASEQRWRSWSHLVTTLAAFAVLIGILCTHWSWWIRLPVSLLAALMHIRLFVIYHDYAHGAILADSRIASVFFRIYGLLVLTPPSVWKSTHDHHHINNTRQVGVDTIGSYPVMTTEAYREASPGVRFFYVLSRHPLTILFGYLTVFLYGFCLLPFWQNPRRHLDALLSIGVHVGLIVVLAVIRPDVMLLAVILPWFLASAIGSYLFYTQHNFPGVRLRHGDEWDYVVAALQSSSFTRMSPVMRWFTGNIGYHHVHHLNSRIPFYRLPEAMAALEDLQNPGTTTLKPADILRCLRLNLWDPEKDRFVTYAEARRLHGSSGP